MQVERCTTAADFLAATLAYRASEPLRTNVLGSVATSVADGSRSYDEYFWWVVRDDDDVVGAAMRTVPHGIALGPMDPPAAARLAAAVADADDGFPFVGGPERAVGAFLDGYTATQSPGSARTVSSGHRDVLYAVDELVVPDVEGSVRTATMHDVELAATWYEAFFVELGDVVPRPGALDRAALETTITQGRLRLWSHDEVPVAMAGHAPPVSGPGGSVARVGPVFTPPAQRRRGYGAAVSAAVTADLLATGAAVMLFADAGNPTSNGVYRSIGYRVADEFVRAVLDTSGAG